MSEPNPPDESLLEVLDDSAEAPHGAVAAPSATLELDDDGSALSESATLELEVDGADYGGLPDEGPPSPPAPEEPAIDYVYGLPPRLDRELLLAYISNKDGGSVLTLLVSAHNVLAFAREPEPRELFAERFGELHAEFERQEATSSAELAGLVQQVQNEPVWREMRQALRSDDAYRKIVVSGFCHDLASARRGKLKAEIVDALDDLVLTPLEQAVIEQSGLAMGFSASEIRDLMKQTSDKMGGTLQVPEPLSDRIQSLGDLSDLANKDLPAAIQELHDAIGEDGRFLPVWLGSCLLTDHPVYAAAKRAAAYLKAAGTEPRERKRARDIGSWDVLWSCGVSWIDFDWGVAGKRRQNRRIGRLSELADRIEKYGVDFMLPAVSTGILSVWLRSQAAPKAELVELAQTAEDLHAQHRGEHVRTQLALHRFAWRVGVRPLWAWNDAASPWKRPTKVNSVPHFEVDNVEGLRDLDPHTTRFRRLVQEGFAAAWVEEHDPPQRFKELLGKGLGRDNDGRLQAQQLQWLLGRKSLANGVLEIEAPTVPAISAAATKHTECFRAFGEAVKDGSVALWLATVDHRLPKTLESFLDKAAAKSVSDPLVLAQLSLLALGERDLLLFSASPGGPTRFSSVGDLVSKAHESWTALESEAFLPVLRAWLGALTKQKLPPKKTSSVAPQVQLLAAVGDTTLRGWDGRPVRDDKKALIGGYKVSPAKAQAQLRRWVEGTDRIPSELVQAQKGGMFGLWMDLQFSTSAGSFPLQRDDKASDRSRLVANLWALGFEPLPVPTVRNESGSDRRFADVGELVDHAHEVWAALNEDDLLVLLQTWLGYRTKKTVKAPSSESRCPVLELLAQTGDTTMRQLDGFPVGAEQSVRFGGLDVPASKAKTAFGQWLNEVPAPPRSIETAFVTGMLEAWADANLPQLGKDIRARLEKQDVRGRFAACLWAFGYEKLALNDRVAVQRPEEIIDIARANLADVERLFDSGTLTAWVSDRDMRERLQKLTERVADAEKALSRGFSKPVAEGVDPSLASAPVEWLILRDRASLAVACLGGSLDQWDVEAPEQTLTGMPADEDLNLPVRLHRTTKGNVPVHVVVVGELTNGATHAGAPTVDPDEIPACLPIPASELENAGRSPVARALVMSVSANRKVRTEDVQLKVELNFAHARFARSLRKGMLRALPGIAIAAVLGLILGWEYTVFAESYARYWHRGASIFGWHWSLFGTVLMLLTVSSAFFLSSRVRSASSRLIRRVQGLMVDEKKKGYILTALYLSPLVVLVVLPLLIAASYAIWAVAGRAATAVAWFAPEGWASQLGFIGLGIAIVLAVLLVAYIVSASLWRARFRALAAGTMAAGVLLCAGLAW